MDMSEERFVAGLKLASGVPEDEPYTIPEMLESIAREAGMRVVPIDWQPEPTQRIYAAMIEAMREVGAVAKLGKYREKQDGPVQYRFRGVDAVVNAAGPAFRKAGIIPVPTLIEAERTPGTTKMGGSKMTTILRVRYDFFAADGSSISALVEGEANDTSDKGTGKGFSVAYRIALLQLLAIPTDDPDPDATRIEGDHTPPMSPALAQFIAGGVKLETLDRLEGLYALLTAHVAPDARVNPEDAQSPVWWELWAKRYEAEVEAALAGGNDALRELWKAALPFGRGFRLGQGRDVNKAITEASMRWGERQKLAIDEAFALIKEAETTEHLDAVAALLKSRLEAREILIGDSLSVLEVIEKKRVRLAEVAQAAGQQAPANLSTWGDNPPNAYDQDGNGRDDD
jgi:hypothetical protein